jgi:hypothetical protein
MCDVMSCRMQADVSDRFPYTCCLRRQRRANTTKEAIPQRQYGSTLPLLNSQPWADSTSLYLLAGEEACRAAFSDQQPRLHVRLVWNLCVSPCPRMTSLVFVKPKRLAIIDYQDM